MSFYNSVLSLNITLLMFVVAATGTPGPNNLMILSSGLNFGVKRSVPHWLGICTGVSMMVLALGLGIAELIQRVPASFTVLKIIGSTYLLYLAYKIARTRIDHSSSEQPNQPMTYWQGALFQWVNPKAWVMVLSALSAFLIQDAALLPQIIAIACTFCFIGLWTVGAWLVAGKGLRSLLNNPKQQQWFNITMSLLLVASVVPMLTSTIQGQ